MYFSELFMRKTVKTSEKPRFSTITRPKLKIFENQVQIRNQEKILHRIDTKIFKIEIKKFLTPVFRKIAKNSNLHKIQKYSECRGIPSGAIQEKSLRP